MRVILDHETFSADNFQTMQALADRVANEVDGLIPGVPEDYPSQGILCFIAPESWNQNADHPAPITLIGPKNEGEPGRTKSGELRIAVYGVEPLRMRRFAMQLAHELAHVKMGARVDNALLETFATAVSYEVLRRFSYSDYLIPMIFTDERLLPDTVQANLAAGNFVELRRYWQQQFSSRWSIISDRPFQTLGALLLQMGNRPNWALLLGIANLSKCKNPISTRPFQICTPNISEMKRLDVGLDVLGFE